MQIQRTPPRPELRPGAGRRPSSPPRPTGGTARRSTAAPGVRRRRCAGRARQDADRRARAAAARSRGGRRLRGVAGNFWVGLALLHTLFTREHNAICDRLRDEYPAWSDDELYDKARLVDRRADGEDPHGRLDAGDHRAPDDGVGDARELVGAQGRAARQAVGRITQSEVLSGIPGSPTTTTASRTR